MPEAVIPNGTTTPGLVGYLVTLLSLNALHGASLFPQSDNAYALALRATDREFQLAFQSLYPHWERLSAKRADNLGVFISQIHRPKNIYLCFK